MVERVVEINNNEPLWHPNNRRQHQGNNGRRNLVIHGELVEDYTRYPYFSLVGEYCGGSLIAPDIILTAGHCKISRSRDGGGGFRHEHIRIGMPTRHRSHHVVHSEEEEDIENDDDQGEDIIHHGIQQVRHPDYEWRGDDEFSHDILIIQLDSPSNRPYIHLDREEIITNNNDTPVLAMGMGWTKRNTPSLSNHLHIVQLNAIDNDTCSQASGRHMSYEDRIDDSMMCTTGGERNERDTCNNDSGSPIIIPGRTPQQDRLVAMVSWGTECADPDFPAVNARISSSYDWIQATTCSLSNYPPVYLCGGGGGSIDTAETFFVQHENRWWWYLCAILPGFFYYYYYCHRKRRSSSEWPKQRRLLPKSTKSENDFCDFLTSSSSSSTHLDGVGKKQQQPSRSEPERHTYGAIIADVDPSSIRTATDDADGGGGGGNA